MPLLRTAAVICVVFAARVAEAGDCVPGDATPERVQIGATGVVVCYDRCRRLDYATRRWAVVPPLAPDAPTHQAAPALTEHDEVESADRSLIAIVGPGEPVRVVSAASRAPVSTIRMWKTEMGDPASVQRVAFVGGALFVAVSSTPVSSQGRLFAPRTGRKLAEIGGHGAELDEGSVVDLGGNRWAFAAFDSAALFVYDVATGKRLSTIRSGPRERGYAAIERVGATLVGVRALARAGVMLYDVGTRKASHATAPTCK